MIGPRQLRPLQITYQQHLEVWPCSQLVPTFYIISFKQQIDQLIWGYGGHLKEPLQYGHGMNIVRVLVQYSQQVYRPQSTHDWVQRQVASIASSTSDELWEDSGGIDISLQELSVADQVDQDIRCVA